MSKPQPMQPNIEPVPEHLPVAITPTTMLDRALSQGAPMEVLEKLMALQERWEANQNRKAFDAAMAKAKAEIPVIMKNRKVDFTSPKGRTNYRYEDFAEVVRTVNPILSKFGLDARFRTTTEGDRIIVTCRISHEAGHSEENSLPGPIDMSGNKNAIQGIGSTVSYLQRYTLKAALGLAASDDDDGRAAADGGPITAEQAAELRSLIAKAAPPDSTDAEKVFLNWAKLENIEDMPAASYSKAVDQLNVKIRKKAEAKP